MPRIFAKGRDGIYYATGYLRDGTRWTRSTGTRKKREAERAAPEFERAAQLEADDAARETRSLGWALSMLVESMTVSGKADGTIRNTKAKAGHLMRILGRNLSLDAFLPPKGVALIAGYVAKRVGPGEGAMRSTIAVEVSVLKMALRVAARSGAFTGDTSLLTIRELRNAHKPRRRWLAPAQAEAVIAETPPQWREHVEVYLGTGVRRMELYAITAADVNSKKPGFVWIEGTKTQLARRFVPMTPRVREILERRAKETPRGPLFREWKRQHLDLADICKRAEVERCTTSDLRRTFASTLLSVGVSASVLKEILGHSTTKQIDLVYGIASDDAKLAAVGLHPASGISDLALRVARLDALEAAGLLDALRAAGFLSDAAVALHPTAGTKDGDG